MKHKLTALERSWVLYDVGNSAFVLMTSTIMPIFFKNLTAAAGVADYDSTAWWSYATAVCTLTVAILGPILGGMADRRGGKKPIFTFFVLLQFWNLFNARVFGTTDSAFKGISKSYGMEFIVLAILVGQFLIVQFGGAVFRTVPLDGQTWLLIIASSSLVLWLGEGIRWVQRLRKK